MHCHVIRPRLAVSRRAAVSLVAAGCIAAAGLSGCSSTADHDEHASRTTGDSEVDGHGTQAAAGQVNELNAADLRTQLEQFLGQHSILTVRLTRARLRGDGDLAQSADAALSKNSSDMGALIGSAYGAEAAAEFEDMWFRHVTLLFDYARGVSDEDVEVQADARNKLDAYTGELSQFLEAATNGAAAASAVRPGLQMHVDHLVQQTDAYAAGDYARAFALERESYARMFPIGTSLAAGIVTGSGAQLPDDFDSPARQLQSRLGMVLGEHAELAVDAMRAGISNTPDFSAAAAALDANTRELTAVIESVFGAAGASQFQALWADHIDAFVTYTTALAGGDEALKSEAQARLQKFNADFSTFLATSTQGRLTAPALADAFVMHEDLLMNQINAYAERDYSTAHQLSFDAYSHMFALAAQAAAAIGDTVASQSPQGGAQTGAGGMSATVVGR
jgi:hypothetical protein